MMWARRRHERPREWPDFYADATHPPDYAEPSMADVLMDAGFTLHLDRTSELTAERDIPGSTMKWRVVAVQVGLGWTVSVTKHHRTGGAAELGALETMVQGPADLRAVLSRHCPEPLEAA